MRPCLSTKSMDRSHSSTSIGAKRILLLLISHNLRYLVRSTTFNINLLKGRKEKKKRIVKQFERIANLPSFFRVKGSMNQGHVLLIAPRFFKERFSGIKWFSQVPGFNNAFKRWEPGSFPGFSSSLQAMATKCGAVFLRIFWLLGHLWLFTFASTFILSGTKPWW